MEVLLTAVLMAWGLVFIIGALNTGLFAGGVNEAELVALSLVQEKAEEIRNADYSSIVTEAKAEVDGFPQFSREVAVTTPQANLKEVTITIYWFAKGDELNTGAVAYVSNT